MARTLIRASCSIHLARASPCRALCHDGPQSTTTSREAMTMHPHFARRTGAALAGATAAAALALAFLPSAALAQAPAPAPLEVPAKTLPVPTTVSPQVQKLIGAPLRPNW